MAYPDSLNHVLNTIHNLEDGASLSLTQYVKRSIVSSRVFIDNTLASEEILKDLMSTIMNLYAGFILTAFSMNQYCTCTKQVRDMMTIVATENFNLNPKFVKEAFRNYFAGLEDIGDIIEDTVKGRYETLTTNQRNTGTDTNISAKHVAEQTLPSGRIINVKMNVNGKEFSFDMFLQLAQTFVPPDVARQFVKLNFNPSFSQRWLQCKAGEISFISDLIMCQDLRKQRMTALKHDKNGVLTDMVERQQNNLENAWLKLSQIEPQRQNIANTILVFEKNNFDKACSEAGLKFSNYDSRQKFFTKTFSFIIAVVDPMYNKINVYFNGLPAVSTFTFDQIKKKAGANTTDILAMMKAFSANVAPKF